jgi:hypothetical protein
MPDGGWSLSADLSKLHCRLLASLDQDRNYIKSRIYVGYKHPWKHRLVSIRHHTRLAEVDKTLTGSGDAKLLQDSTDKSRKIRGAM